MKKVVAAVASLLLTSCSFGMMKDGLTRLQGQPISVAIAKLGVPDRDELIANQRVYFWYRSTFDEGSQYQCKIKLVTTPPSDLITTFEWEGNNNMCYRYAQRLSG